jgi:SAM-dependent methyltransferase
MCNSSCIKFGLTLTKEEVEGKSVIEVGSYNVNGSLRDLVAILKPKSYLGVDIVEGPYVDEICKAEDLVDKYGKESFDVVISTELMEHVKDWRLVISNFKRICKTGGIILITTRSVGFPKHDYPNDYWRYEPFDMERIFADCTIQEIRKDPEDPGVFIKVRKPEKFNEGDLGSIRLFNINEGN